MKKFIIFLDNVKDIIPLILIGVIILAFLIGFLGTLIYIAFMQPLIGLIMVLTFVFVSGLMYLNDRWDDIVRWAKNEEE